MRLGLVLGEAGQGLRRNISMVISVVLVTFISLTFVGAAILLQFQIGQMKGYWYDKAQVAVYLCTATETGGNCAQAEATQDQKDAVAAQLNSPTLKPYVKKYYFQSHQQAYDIFKKQFSNSTLAGFATPAMLNEAYMVNLNDPGQAEILVDSLKALPGVNEVVDQRSYLDQIFAVLNAASITAIGLASLMLVAAALLIATTIRLSAFSRRRELGIMRLVGASNRFIQTPFILEGVISSLIGSVLAGGAILAIVQFFVKGYLGASIGTTTQLVDMNDAYVVVPILIILGAVLAAASAGAAINRYLKV
ncbi:MAG: transporter permease [Glaciihabitans sp.]|nr:transporter permease [Glaciihabitans sp.]MCU1534419.1 transporter permease [Glaciihabitans sp.]MDQ1556499.1 cell division transport system permease protein [Actinomycetota bacterium]